MQEKTLFEYAIIRVVPRVEREEFMNVGVILYCAKQKFLKSIFYLDEIRLKALDHQLDVDFLKENLNSFGQITLGDKLGGPIALLDPPSRFRWLTATRSTVVQCSKVHPGFTMEAESTLLKLHQDLVL